MGDEFDNIFNDDEATEPVSDPEMERISDTLSNHKPLQALELILAELERNPHGRVDLPRRSELLFKAGLSCFALRRFDEAWAWFHKGLTLNRESDGRCAPFLHELSLIAVERRDLVSAKQLVEAALMERIPQCFIRVRTGLALHTSYELNLLIPYINTFARVCRETNDAQKAVQLLTILRTICQRSYRVDVLGVVLKHLALSYAHIGDRVRSLYWFMEAIRVQLRNNDVEGVRASVGNVNALLQHDPALLSDKRAEYILTCLRTLLA